MKSDIEQIRVRRREPNFDRACDEAYRWAVSLFGIDEAGHAKDKRFDRSSSCLKVQFKTYTHTGSMGGQEYLYEFEAWMEKFEDEEDEDEEDDE